VYAVYVFYQKRREESVPLQVSASSWKSTYAMQICNALVAWSPLTNRDEVVTRRGDPHAGEWERNRCARGGVKLAETRGARPDATNNIMRHADPPQRRDGETCPTRRGPPAPANPLLPPRRFLLPLPLSLLLASFPTTRARTPPFHPHLPPLHPPHLTEAIAARTPRSPQPLPAAARVLGGGVVCRALSNSRGGGPSAARRAGGSAVLAEDYFFLSL
jgi:hypothetical protein